MVPFAVGADMFIPPNAAIIKTDIAKVVNDPARGCAARVEFSLFGTIDLWKCWEVCCRCQEVQQTPTSNFEYLLQVGAAAKVEQARRS